MFIEPQNIIKPLANGEIEEKAATCSCGSGIPIQKIDIEGQEISLLALPLIFQQFREAGKKPCDVTFSELMGTVKIYNPIPGEKEQTYTAVIAQEYTAYWEKGTEA